MTTSSPILYITEALPDRAAPPPHSKHEKNVESLWPLSARAGMRATYDDGEQYRPATARPAGQSNVRPVDLLRPLPKQWPRQLSSLCPLPPECPGGIRRASAQHIVAPNMKLAHDMTSERTLCIQHSHKSHHSTATKDHDAAAEPAVAGIDHELDRGHDVHHSQGVRTAKRLLTTTQGRNHEAADVDDHPAAISYRRHTLDPILPEASDTCNGIPAQRRESADHCIGLSS
jgi:hypothetical protein